jgi:eukaryotic-like serine/threonine-protein kinase
MTQDFFHKQDTLPNLVTEEEEVHIPEKIGPYKIETLLNKGGMSWLYLGIDPQTKHPLAIKTLSPAHLKDPASVERFLKESHIIALTNHPNIVKLYGEGRWEDGLYIAMEWIRGISLRQFLMQQSLSLKRSLDIVLQVSYALRHLHSHNVIHRDLKPENILITEDGEIKVIDFGIAQLGLEKPVQPLFNQQGILGTPNYMSPEQKEDPSHVTFASDIYSLGIIAYELILGKLSYGVINISLLPKELRKIITKALAVSIEERYQNITDFIVDISRYLKSGDIDKEKPDQDQAKEILEIFEKASQSLSPSVSIPWTAADIGMAKLKSISLFGLYYDLFKLPDNSYLIVIIDPLQQNLENLFSSASIRGSLRAFLPQFFPNTKQPFQLVRWIEALHEFFKDDPFVSRFACACLYLHPLRDQMIFFNSGLSNLIHVPEGAEPRVLHNANPLLGKEANPEFVSTSDNWNIGDILVFHSLVAEHRTSPSERTLMEDHMKQLVQEDLFLSAQPQAESILRKSQNISLFSQSKHTKVVISVQRIM